MKNNINIGDNNKIKNSNISTGNIEENSKEKKPFLNKILIPIIITVIGGVVAAIVIAALNIGK